MFFHNENGLYIYKNNTVARSCNHCYPGKAINVTYSQCVSTALVIQGVKHMRPVIMSSVASPTLPYFSTFTKGYDIRGRGGGGGGGFIKHKICVLCETFLILKRTEPEVSINVLKSLRKVPVILVRF